MTLEILQVPGCPGADLLAHRLEALPTLPADSSDPFTPPGGQLPSLSCRLYPGDHDGPGQAPSPGQLRAALGW